MKGLPELAWHQTLTNQWLSSTCSSQKILAKKKRCPPPRVFPTLNPKLKQVFCAMKRAILFRPVVGLDLAWQMILTNQWVSSNWVS